MASPAPITPSHVLALRALYALETAGVVRLKQVGDKLAVARHKDHYCQTVIVVHPETFRWKDLRSDTNGSGLYPLCSRLDIPLDLAGSALDVTDEA